MPYRVQDEDLQGIWKRGVYLVIFKRLPPTSMTYWPGRMRMAFERVSHHSKALSGKGMLTSTVLPAATATRWKARSVRMGPSVSPTLFIYTSTVSSPSHLDLLLRESVSLPSAKRGLP